MMKLTYLTIKIYLGLIGLVLSTSAIALTANKVWMELQANGRYRVYANVTIPEIKEFREYRVDFVSKKKAEKYYFDLVKGVDFYMPHADDRAFKQTPTKPQPW